MPLPQGLLGQGAAVGASPQDAAAKKAAQEALQEAIAQQNGGGKPAEPLDIPGKWTVPQLPDFVDVQAAVDEAMDDARRFMNHRMQGEGVVLTLQQQPEQTDSAWEALVVEDGTHRVLQRYGGADLLKLYAAHSTGRGVVVDGEV
jgi:hypothetical protein